MIVRLIILAVLVAGLVIAVRGLIEPRQANTSKQHTVVDKPRTDDAKRFAPDWN